MVARLPSPWDSLFSGFLLLVLGSVVSQNEWLCEVHGVRIKTWKARVFLGCFAGRDQICDKRFPTYGVLEDIQNGSYISIHI